MIDKILKETDNNSRGEIIAILLTIVDWKEAFDRQCPKLGIESFQKCGVRPALIPLLTNYFQDRKIRVKWHGYVSETKSQNGSGPQGSFFGILEYLAQTNFNTKFLTDEEKYKFVDDLSILEIINLLSIGLCSYNMKAHVASDIKSNNAYIPAENLKSQSYLQQISEWTVNQKMKLTEEKTKQIIFNFKNNYQFCTRNKLNYKNVEVLEKTKLLGTVITNDLKWEENTALIEKKANTRMQLLRKCATFTTNQEELKNIYILFVRSILEQSCVVWHSSLTIEDSNDLERVQKSAIKIILKEEYEEYEPGLQKLNIQSLHERRITLCENFAINTSKHETLHTMFPRNENKATLEPRNTESFKVNMALTERYKKSSIPYMQRMLNNLEKEIEIDTSHKKDP